MQRADIARFYHCSDAEGYVQVLRQIDPEHQYEVMFDPGEMPEGDR